MKKLRFTFLALISVICLAFGLSACSLMEPKTRLAPPTDVAVEGDTLSWKAVEGATAGYTVKINADESTQVIGGTSLDLKTVTGKLKEGSNTLAVKANESETGFESAYSAVVTYTYDPATLPPAHTHTPVEHKAQDATCEEDGNSAYWSCEGCGKFFSDAKCEHEVAKDSWVLKALGHDYGDPEWTWEEAEGGFTASAKFVCEHDAQHIVTENAQVKLTGTQEATCEIAGKTTYSATVTFDEEQYTDTKEVEIPATGHAYGDPEWTWEADFSKATAKFTCANDATHVETVVATGDAITQTEKQTGCTKDIVYTAKVTFEEEDYTDSKTKTLEGQHSLGEWEAEVPATCTTPGTKGHYTCSECGLYFDEDGSTQIEDLTINIDPDAHDLIEVGAKQPTCTEDGWEAYQKCQREGCDYVEEHQTLPATGHSYSEAEWTWTESGDSFTVKATFKCSVCGEGEETVDVTDITSKRTAEPTCADKGTLTYTATVEFKGNSYTDTHDVDIPATGEHDYVGQGWVTDGTHHWHECKVCGTPDEKVEHTYSTPNKDANQHWNECVCGKKSDVADHQYDTPKHDTQNHWNECSCGARSGETQHTFNVLKHDPQHHWYECDCGEKSSEEFAHTSEKGYQHDSTNHWKECDTCHEQFDKAVHDSDVTLDSVDATCTQKGKTEGKKCSVCGEITKAQQETDMLKHLLTIHEEETLDSCTEEGHLAYWQCDSCKQYFKDDQGNEKYNENEWVKHAKGHDMGDKVEKKQPTCEEDGNEEYYHCRRCDKYFKDANGGEEYSQGKPVLEKLNHQNAQKTEAVEAGVEKEGNDAYWYCEDCGTYFKDEKGVRGDKLENNEAPTIPAIVITQIDKYETYISNNDYGIEEKYPNGQSIYYIFRIFRDADGTAWKIPQEKLISTLTIDGKDAKANVEITEREDNQYVFAVSVDRPTDDGRTISYQLYGEKEQTTVKLTFKGDNFWFASDGTKTNRAYNDQGKVLGTAAGAATTAEAPVLFDIYAQGDVIVENFGDKAVELKGMPILSGVNREDVNTFTGLAAQLLLNKVLQENEEELSIVIVGYHRWEDEAGQSTVYTLVNSAAVSDVLTVSADDARLICNPGDSWHLGEPNGNIQYRWEVFEDNSGMQEGAYIYIYNANDVDDAQTHDFSQDKPFAQYKIQAKGDISQKTLDQAIDAAWLAYAQENKGGIFVTKYKFVFAMRTEPTEDAIAKGFLPSMLVYADSNGSRDVREYDLASQISSESGIFDLGIWDNAPHNFSLITVANITNWLTSFNARLEEFGLQDEYVINSDNVENYFEIEISTKEKTEEGYERINYEFSIRAPFKNQGYSFDAFVAAMTKDYFVKNPDADKEGEGDLFKFELYLSIVLKEKINGEANKLLQYFRASDKKLVAAGTDNIYQSHTFKKADVTAYNNPQVCFDGNHNMAFFRDPEGTDAKKGEVFLTYHVDYVLLKIEKDGTTLNLAFYYEDGVSKLYRLDEDGQPMKDKVFETGDLNSNQSFYNTSDSWCTPGDFNQFINQLFSDVFTEEVGKFDVADGWVLKTQIIVSKENKDCMWLNSGEWSEGVTYNA